MTNKILPQEADAISRISGLVLVNAMIFQEILAYHDDRVDSLEKTLDEPNLLGSFSAHWRFILKDINYYPIFSSGQGHHYKSDRGRGYYRGAQEFGRHGSKNS